MLGDIFFNLFIMPLELIFEVIFWFLKDHPAVDRVYYPGLPDAQGYDINRRQAKNGGVILCGRSRQRRHIQRNCALHQGT